ncbi:hypothetical protein [Photobacterium profundum]|uniref:Uncharacterized protein n=1 Tax=Photobacterium profundum (strain SS9) TaxID=298386 RepID=Q6LJN5_PHOPR|nr:hypothetical protein [Photobacterium profundum]CAG22495.1 hypothetical protein PBPRB0622 [Photobacterium profundum SS9]
MQPNFHTNQLTDEYIETVKANPTVEATDELLSGQFDEIESSQNTLNWDVPHYGPYKYIREVVGLLAFLFMYGGGGYIKIIGATLFQHGMLHFLCL